MPTHFIGFSTFKFLFILTDYDKGKEMGGIKSFYVFDMY